MNKNMKNIIISLLVGTYCLSAAAINKQAHAEKPQKNDKVYMHNLTIDVTENDVKNAIQKCKDGFDISTTASMANSTFSTSDCLDELVINLMNITTTQNEDETLYQLKQLRTGYVALKSTLFFNYVGCNGPCGTMWSGMGTSYYNTLLEEIALDIIKHHEFQQ